jgi:Zn-dependent oligopeptidase
MEDLKVFAKDSGSPEANDLTHWDLTFWSERLRESKYDINEVCFFYFASFKYLNSFSCKLLSFFYCCQ